MQTLRQTLPRTHRTLCPLRGGVAGRSGSIRNPRESVNAGGGAASRANYYEVLGIGDDATPEELKAAFRAKSKLLHPDVNKEPTATQDFMLLRRAYTTLSTAELRAEYASKLGMPSARASDPRFARFERWRREVVPDLEVQLDVWSRGIDGFVDAWRISVEQRERALTRLYNACLLSLRQLQQLQRQQADAAAAGAEKTQQTRHRSPSASSAPSSSPPGWQPLQPLETANSMASAGSASFDGAAAPSYEAGARMGSNARASSSSPSTSGISGSLNRNSSGGGSSSAWEARSSKVESSGGLAVEPQPAPGYADLLPALEESLRAMEEQVAGIGSDEGDGTARVQREVDKRYEQVATRYPAYPDIVWIDVWEETAERWLWQAQEQARCCREAEARWSGVSAHLREELVQVAAGHAAGASGRIAGAGTGSFYSG